MGQSRAIPSAVLPALENLVYAYHSIENHTVDNTATANLSTVLRYASGSYKWMGGEVQ